MRFEDIPKRAAKSEYALDFGFWHRVRGMTNSLGNSPFGNILVAIIAPIVLNLIAVVILLSLTLLTNYSDGEGIVRYFISFFIVIIIQVLIQWLIYSYIGYISYHQIRYDINRITGVVTIAIILISIPSLIFLSKFFNLGSLYLN